MASEHIFPATRITEMTLRWKDANATGRADEASQLLVDIIKESEPMFVRFAQHEGFDSTVDLGTLISSANQKMVRWLLAWEPKKGRLFSWFCACAKNAWRSDANKETTFRKRFHVTSDNLEKFFGAEEHKVDAREALKGARDRMSEIYARWGSAQELGVIRYCLECLAEGAEDRDAVIRGATFAWAADPDLVKFLYGWCLFELRSAFYDRVRIPFTEQDLLRAANSYTYLPDLLNIITFDQMAKMIAVMGGTKLKIPTLASMARLKEDYEMTVEMIGSDQTPDSFAKIAQKRKRSAGTASEVYAYMVSIMDETKGGEHQVFEDNHDDDNDEFDDDDDSV